MLLSTLVTSLLGNMLSTKGVICQLMKEQLDLVKMF